MGCFPCCPSEDETESKKHERLPVAQPKYANPPPAAAVQGNNTPVTHDNSKSSEPVTPTDEETSNTGTAKTFTFRELANATKHFRQECLLGEGGIGKVFKATFPSSGQTVAVRQLDRTKTQGSKEFQVEVLILSLLHHPNLVDLIGYCADGEQRLLVYEYIPTGSLESHLFDISEDKRPLDWSTRLKIASGVAEGLAYLHEKANPPIIYRNLKSSNIMMDEDCNPKLLQYGLAKLLQTGNKMNMSAYGYCAPEHERHGEITPKSDVYSFGVVLLELITGRRAYDGSRPRDEQSLVGWAQPIFRDPTRFPDMADPLLRREFSVKTLNQAVGIASMCLQEEPSVRPFISDVVATLSFLATAPPDEPIPEHLVPILSSSRVELSSEEHHNEHEYEEVEVEVESSDDDSSEDGSEREETYEKFEQLKSSSSDAEDGSERGEQSEKFEQHKSSSSDGREREFSPGFDLR